MKHNLTDEDTWEIARVAHGFVGADLCLFVKEACFTAMRRCSKRKLANPADMWVSNFCCEALAGTKQAPKKRAGMYTESSGYLFKFSGRDQ